MDETKNPPLFVVEEAPTVLWPVYVRVPVDGGDWAVHRFHARIRVHTEERYAELLDAPRAEAEAAPASPSMRETLADNAQRFPEHVVGFGDDLRDGAGGAIPYSVEKLQALVTGPYGEALSVGLWRAISEVRFGARLGNFEPPPAAGSKGEAAAD